MWSLRSGVVAVRRHHLLADELREFLRADFAQALEARVAGFR